MRLAALVVALAPLAGCALTYRALALPENIECHDHAYTAMIDLATAAVIGGISYAEDGGTAGYVASGVFVGSALVGITSAIVCDAKHERNAASAVYYPRGSNQPPESLRLDPQTSELRDATPEELGLVPTPHARPDLAVHPATTGDSPPNRDSPAKPKLQPQVPPPPPCQLSPRIACPEKTYCLLTEENRGHCTAIE